MRDEEASHHLPPESSVGPTSRRPQMQAPCPFETFPALDVLPRLRAAFLRRAPGVDVQTDRDSALARLCDIHHATKEVLGFERMHLATAEQVHGREIAIISDSDQFPIAGCDGLLTTAPGLCLGIYVADCAAVYIADRFARGIALVHSGKKGTELGIVPHAVEMLCRACDARPDDLVVQIAPCIRPPHYEIDFAKEIVRQATAAGVRNVHDCGTCTASNPEAYYSYRREMGQTGRMLALMAIQA